jgi:GT2 family glycosyltransferase
MGGGNNLGIKNSHGDSILILNPDTLIHKDSILHLHRHLHANEKTGIVGPKLLNTDGTLQYSCLCFPKLYTPILRRTFFGGLIPKHLNEFLMKDYDHENSREVDWLMGSCLLVKRKMLEVLDCLFDEKFFMYFEDTDLCRRAKKAGWKVVYHPQAVVIHDHARASASYPWYIAPFVDTLAREHIKSWLKYFFR